MTPERFRRIEEIYHAAREEQPEQRAAILARTDPETRREVELLLSEFGGCEFLDRPAIRNAPELVEDSSPAGLAPGTLLGPYRIESKLGEGGMGEVFRAIDTRLGRAVAVKTAREPFDAHFDREARAIAALNHTNICQIYDVGPNYLVMELVEGPTLADRIQHTGGVPCGEALTIARQIGDALEAAHEQGIIHRDLKPANIKIKPDGTVKVLDFGLAKIVERSARPTESSGRVSRVHEIIGTAAYMAPEQARGKAADKRADIWAFGVVLYEMLTGRRPFQGETISDTLAGVLTQEPEWELVPPKAQQLLKSCLEKDPKRRLRDIADAWKLLEESPARGAGNRMPWIAAGVFAVTTALAVWAPWRYGQIEVERPSTRIDLDLGAGVSLAGDAGPAVALSPDGTRIVYVAQDQAGVSRLFHRRLDQPGAALLFGTEGAAQPFFSPDGQWVGFFAQGKLRKIRIDGGQPISLCDAPSGRGASWGEDGNIIAALDTNVGLSQVPSGGGNALPLTELGAGEACHRWPHVLPGGKFVLFTASSVINNFDQADIALLSLEDHSRKLLLAHAGMYPQFLPSGQLVYVTNGNLFAVPFDAKTLRVVGGAARLGEVGADTPRGYAQVDFSASGICALLTRGGQGLSTPQWLDSVGNTASLGLEMGRYHYLRLSPDGSRLAYVSTHGSNSDLYIYDWQRSINTRLTSASVTRSPVWTPDGRFVVFGGGAGIFAVQTDGGGMPAQLTRSDNRQTPEAFSPDGQRLVFTDSGTKGEIRILPINIEGGLMRAGAPEALFKTSGTPEHPAFSPDGRWVAYSNAEGGSYQVYVRAVPDNGTQVQVSNGGGIIPIWSRDGRELFYRTEDQRIMVVSYAVRGESFVAERPREWYVKRLANIGANPNLDLAPDGRRFVALMPADVGDARESQSHITVVINFFDEVRKRLAERSK